MTTPNGCQHCGVDQREHLQRWKPPVGWHQWEQPTQQQIKDRMLARRAEGTPMTDQPTRPAFRYAEGDDPYAESPDAGNDNACNCGGAWHAMKQHCVDWPCPGCTRICPSEPGTA